MYILINTLHKFDREFKEQNPDLGTYIDWSNDDTQIEAYLQAGYPKPVGYPTLVDEDSKVAIAYTEGDPEDILEQAKYDAAAKYIRDTRDKALDSSDKYLMPDNPISDNDKQDWIDYRYLLREITTQSGFPFDVEWPVPPMPEES